MSVASRIRGAVQSTEIPCYQNEYTGNASRYFVFTIGTQPLLFADDVPDHGMECIHGGRDFSTRALKRSWSK